MRQGVRIAVDVGQVRVGIARSDSDGILAMPVGTYQRGKNDFSAVRELIDTHQVLEIIVGLPRNMDGSEGKSASEARRWARRIARKVAPIPVRMVDERLSTVSAHQLLHEAGRKEITHRSVIDQVAAGIILESALAQERTTGSPPGELISVQEN
ncbi:Holliday junction resolvase RuvX [Arcanobacterium pinnipediorum]|uniref:Putative pre-16S rRNA nuclease n=1 Tax=Arcanobacterium pinnipediorum TaxID=1503041 RepID=A0ABY5ALW2_9ACTO|nr:Holliday junction resolvase RuvX [Arcanobacterium pinnipediorum]USR80183.1 Holliday junction resolvase RuvX [Arcanobacterium pinnipediorum]